MAKEFSNLAGLLLLTQQLYYEIPYYAFDQC